jgi:hypothetical protein
VGKGSRRSLCIKKEKQKFKSSMKKSISITILLVSISLFGCEHLKKHFASHNGDNRIMLKRETLNVVTMKDTMIIYEGVCRGCAYENSTHFEIIDTNGIVELNRIITTDNTPKDVDGGNINKDLVIIPKKTGSTTIKLYKFSKEIPDAADSLNFSQYKIEVRN